jgi:acyl-coenzyme A synthetase/AMP-(fatty) acid ligase
VGTIGLPSGIEFRIDDQQHLYIHGPATFYSDWFDTGDLADQDNRGYVRILGRSIDRINIKGYKIDPLSIENQLYNEFKDIKEVAVFGSDRLKCVYVGDVDLHKVSAFLVSLGTACRPKLLQRIDEIPKNTVGKISRSSLNQRF